MAYQRLYMAKWRAANREHIRAYKRAQYAANIDVERAKLRERRAADPEKCRQRIRVWQRENRERYRVMNREYYAKNLERERARKRKYYAENPGVAKDSRDRRNRIVAGQAIAKAHRKETVAFMRACPPGHHVDHIVPLRGKSVCGLHVPWNLQYLSAARNLSKGNKLQAE